jgi:hypothetical protein
MHYNRIFFLWLTIFALAMNGRAQQNIFSNSDEDKLPYGDVYLKWEKSTRPSHTYIVSQMHPQASDSNPGTHELPFLTINKAAEILQPGQRVLIKTGTYHETIRPIRGGESADKMIIYEAAEGEKVVVTGAVVVNPTQWKKSTGWQVGGRGPFAEQRQNQQVIWQCELREFDFDGYNPFGMLNLMHDQEYLDYTKVNMTSHFKKRGWVLADGQLLEQVSKPVELMDKENGAYWSEHNGMRLHVRFPEGKSPENCKIEITTREQLFAPIEYGLGYIKIKGIHFRYAANGFPVPQRGAVSASRGHHWIIEDCTIEGINALGVDLGNEMWHTETQEIVGFHIFRRNNIINCGVSGLQGMRGINYLIEDNLFEDIGWHNVEHGWESGAIKLHLSRNTLIRRNVFRNIRHAPGIWLDYNASQNCRITRNVFTGITSARGAIYIEVSRELIHIDHNIIHDTHSQYWISGDYGAGGSALYTDGSDSIRFFNNLALDIENTGFGAYANASRIVNGRGGTDRNHEVKNNIFIRCGKHGIEFPNVHHFADFNVYANMPSGYLKIKNPAPELLLDIKAWQDYYGWERNGKHIRSVQMELDPKTLKLTFDKGFLSGINAGPFNSRIDFSQGVSIDPRKK